MMQNCSDICLHRTNQGRDICVTNVNPVVMQNCDPGQTIHYFKIKPVQRIFNYPL